MTENTKKEKIKDRLLFDKSTPSQSTKSNELLIESYREGDIMGDHTVRYENIIDILEITHSAKSRYGFAQGAVLAAEWLIGKKGIYTLDDILKF